MAYFLLQAAHTTERMLAENEPLVTRLQGECAQIN